MQDYDDPAGPWQRIPDNYRPSVKDRYCPHQVELGVGVNEEEMRLFAKYIGADDKGSIGSVINEVKAYCTKHCHMPRYIPRIKYRMLADPDTRYGFCILSNYDLGDVNPDDFDRAFYLLQTMWQTAGIQRKTLWHLSATNARAEDARKASGVHPLPTDYSTNRFFSDVGRTCMGRARQCNRLIASSKRGM